MSPGRLYLVSLGLALTGGATLGVAAGRDSAQALVAAIAALATAVLLLVLAAYAERQLSPDAGGWLPGSDPLRRRARGRSCLPDRLFDRVGFPNRPLSDCGLKRRADGVLYVRARLAYERRMRRRPARVREGGGTASPPVSSPLSARLSAGDGFLVAARALRLGLPRQVAGLVPARRQLAHAHRAVLRVDASTTTRVPGNDVSTRIAPVAVVHRHGDCIMTLPLRYHTTDEAVLARREPGSVWGESAEDLDPWVSQGRTPCVIPETHPHPLDAPFAA